MAKILIFKEIKMLIEILLFHFFQLCFL